MREVRVNDQFKAGTNAPTMIFAMRAVTGMNYGGGWGAAGANAAAANPASTILAPVDNERHPRGNSGEEIRHGIVKERAKRSGSKRENNVF